MPPLIWLSFSCRSLERRGDSFGFFPLAGSMASDGMFHVLPTRCAPGMRPVEHQLRTVLSGTSNLAANSVIEMYSICYRQNIVFLMYKYSISCRYRQEIVHIPITIVVDAMLDKRNTFIIFALAKRSFRKPLFRN